MLPAREGRPPGLGEPPPALSVLAPDHERRGIADPGIAINYFWPLTAQKRLLQPEILQRRSRAEGDQQLLRDVRRERREQLRAAAPSASSSASRSSLLSWPRRSTHPLLEVLDPVEQADDVAHRLVHLQLLQVLGDLLRRRSRTICPGARGCRRCPAAASASSGASCRRAAMQTVRVVPEASAGSGEAKRSAPVGPVERLLRARRRRAPRAARCRRRSSRPARRGRRRCRGACSSCARRRSPSRGTGSRRTARRRRGRRAGRCRAAPWSRSAGRRRSCRCPSPRRAARRAASAQVRGWVKICSSRLGGRDAGRHPQPQRVEVAVERVGLAAAPAPPQVGQVVSTKSDALGQRVALAGRLEVERQQHRQLLERDRHHPAPLAVARSGSACPTSAGARSRSRRRGSASPARVFSAVAAPSAERLARRRSASAPRSPRRPASTPGMPSTAVGPKRASTSGETKHRQATAAGGVDRGRRCRSPASRRRRARCAPSRPSAAPRAARATGGIARPALDLRVPRREQHEARLADRLGVRREDAQATAVRADAGRARPRRLGRARSAGWPARARPTSARELARGRRSFSSR